MPLVCGCEGGAKAVLGAQVTAQLVERALTAGSALALTEQAVGELFAARHCPRTNGGQWLDHSLLVKVDHHGPTPFRMSLRTDLAMKNAERRGSM